MSYEQSVALLALALFAGIVGLIEVGRHLGARRLARGSAASRAGLGAVETAVFALMGLLLAFTFSGATGRWDTRRALIVEEGNNIGTAWLRIDLLPTESQPAMRDLFRRYVDSRIATYRALPDVDLARHDLAQSIALQNEIWSLAVAALRPAPAQATLLVLPALNDMIDVTTTRTVAIQTHPPLVIYGLLFGLVLISALMAGYAMAEGLERSWTHVVGFAAAMAVTVFVILNIEYPRLGLIRIDALDQILADVRRSMD